MSLLDDPFYGPAITKWLETDGGCEECKVAIKSQAGNTVWEFPIPTTDTFDTWYLGDNEVLLPNSARVQKYLECLRSSSFKGWMGNYISYLADAAGLDPQVIYLGAKDPDFLEPANLLERADFLERAIIEIILARVAPNVPDHNFVIFGRLDATEPDAIERRAIEYLESTRIWIPHEAKPGHPNCPKWASWL
jgi:hypothetical protein